MCLLINWLKLSGVSVNKICSICLQTASFSHNQDVRFSFMQLSSGHCFICYTLLMSLWAEESSPIAAKVCKRTKKLFCSPSLNIQMTMKQGWVSTMILYTNLKTYSSIGLINLHSIFFFQKGCALWMYLLFQINAYFELSIKKILQKKH